MAVLLQYNEADQWTMGQLAESTQIKKDILVQVGYQSVYMDTSVLADIYPWQHC